MKNKVTGYRLQATGWLFAFCLLPSYFLHAQEVLLDLGMNPVVAKKYHDSKNSTLKINPVKLDTIDISAMGFLDDFSKDGIYPDSSLWLDSNVFINRDYPIAPPTLGVATFDGVSKSGCPYDTTASSISSDSADVLTSKPIKLGLFSSADNIYFSFFWQARGRGNLPDPYDSLVLEFFSPSLNQWNHIWAREGYTPSSPPDSIFRLTMIPITDPAYLQNGFQFRFRNYATVSGNVDHWHIDYVYLDKNRNAGDTIFDDVAFVYNSRSLLKNYYAMPWEQYTASEMKTNLAFFIRNNDTDTANTSFKYTIKDNMGVTKASYNGGSGNIFPFNTNGYYNNPLFANPGIGDLNPPTIPTLIPYSFPTLTQDTSFLLKCVLTPPISDLDQWNDTLRFTQTFNNYYAYDDGTVEAGYGLNIAGGKIAYKFTLNQTDVLYAVYMLFNWIPPGVNQQQFKIRIWSDSSGFPGPMIYEDIATTPNYQYVYYNWANTNMFYPYILQTPQSLSGTFYVGFIQYTNPSTTLLNLGLDKNTNSNSKMYYDAGSGWTQSTLQGTWMIRPVFGDIDGLLNVPVEESISSAITVFPNPTNGEFRVQSSEFGVRSLEIYNVFGEKVFDSAMQQFSNSAIDASTTLSINISSQPNGIYFLRVTEETGITHSQKLILAK